MPSLRIAVAFFAGAGALAGCSASHGARGLGPTTTTPAERFASLKTASMDEFCGRLNGLTTATAKVGIVTDLAEVRSRMATATVLADQATAAGTPRGSGTFPTLWSLDSDIRVVNAWVQKGATQSDLDHDRQPGDVHAHFIDMGVQFRSLEGWSSSHCQAYGSGHD